MLIYDEYDVDPQNTVDQLMVKINLGNLLAVSIRLLVVTCSEDKMLSKLFCFKSNVIDKTFKFRDMIGSLIFFNSNRQTSE